ncbi:MAG: protein kinase domain-containing protein [Inhella sp.]
MFPAVPVSPAPSPSPAKTAEDQRQALPAGTRFGELEILRTLGIGGFGIVYLARDHALERDVAIKEFMPAHLAWRSTDTHVSVRTSAHLKTFESGRRSFVNEARLLARFDHPSLLKVYRFWEDHGTAYMAMPYLQGQTLSAARKALGRAPDEAWIRQRFLPLLDALALLHASGVFHRDIAPDNIWLSAPDELPILLDFGAARREMGDQTQGFTAILKPSYAPIEQYADSSTMRQGPWTDLYALGAVLYHLLVGKAPPPATARIVADECQPLSQRNTPAFQGYSAGLLQAIDWAMSIRPKDRPASVADFRAVLLGERSAPPRTPWEPPAPDLQHPLLNLPPQSDPMATTVREARDDATAQAEPAPVTSSAPASSPTEPRSQRASAAPSASKRSREKLAVTVALADTQALQGGGKNGGQSSLRWGGWGGATIAVGLALALLYALTRVLAPATEAAPASTTVAEPLPASAAPLSGAASEAPAVAPLPEAARATSSPAGVTPSPDRSAPTTASPKPTPRREALPKPAPAPLATGSTAPVVATSPAPAASVPTPTASAAPRAEPSPEDPNAACADRPNFLAKEFCVARRCERPNFAAHPACLRIQELREQQRPQRN